GGRLRRARHPRPHRPAARAVRAGLGPGARRRPAALRRARDGGRSPVTAVVDAVTAARQVDPVEQAYADELAFLAAHDDGPRPPGWRLTPRAVVTFVAGSDG